MHSHLRTVKGYKADVKLAETIGLQIFATNVLNVCKQKGIAIEPTFKAAGLRKQMIYEMRKGTFYRFINYYTMVHISKLLDVPFQSLFNDSSDLIATDALIGYREDNKLLGCIKMNQSQYAAKRGVTTPTVCIQVRDALRKGSYSSLPGVVQIDKFSTRQYVLYVKV